MRTTNRLANAAPSGNLNGIRLVAATLILALLTTLSAALIVVISGVTLPLTAAHRASLAAQLSQHLGYQVSFDALAVQLHDWQPRFIFQHFHLDAPNPAPPAFTASALELDLDLVGSWRSASPQFRRFHLVGAALNVVRSRDNRWFLQGFEALKTQPDALARFLAHGHVSLSDSTLQVTDERQPNVRPLVLRDVALQLHNAGWQHQVELTVNTAVPVAPGAVPHRPPTVGKIPPNPPFSKGGDEKPSIEKDAASKPSFEKGGLGGFNEELHFTANLNGNPTTPTAWDGELELRYNGDNLGAFLAGTLPTNTRFTTTRAHLNSWLRLRAGAIEQVTLQLDLLGVNVAAANALTIDRLQTQAQLQRQPDAGWELTLVDLSASQPSSHGGTGIAGVNLKLLTTAAGAPTQVAITANQLDLADLSALLRASPWPVPAALQPLLAAQPHGRLSEFAVHAQRPAVDQAWQWQTAAALFVVGSQRTATQPGWSGIDGQLTANQDGGQLQLDAQHLTLDAQIHPDPPFSKGGEVSDTNTLRKRGAGIFAAPLDFDQLSGQIQWRRTAAGWQFDGRELQVANADLSGNARFALTLPADGSSPQLELHAQLRNLPAARVTQYLPINKLSPALVAWLQRALLAGRITSADLDVNGRLADYPFRDRPGQFDLRLAFTELDLGYHPDWPPLTAANGTLHLHNQGLTIAVQRGRIYDSDFSAGAVDIPELRGLQEVVIRGVITGPFNDGVRALTTTPLATKLGAIGKLLTVSGRSQLALTVTVPLVKGGHVGVNGTLSWPQAATLALRQTPVQLTALGGALQFTESGLRSEALMATLWGQTTQLKLVTEGTAAALRLNINAESKTPLVQLAQQVPSPVWELASGALTWQLAVTVPPPGTVPLALEYRLTSDLRGVALKLPAPLGKLAPAAQQLALNGTLIPNQMLTLNGAVGALATQLKVALEDGGARVVGGQLRLGVAKSPPTPLFQRENESGLVLAGRLQELNLSAWLELLGQFDAARAKKSASSHKSGAALPLALDLRVERLALGTLRFHNVTLRREMTQPAGEITIKSNELIGKVRLADGVARPLALTLERLDLQPLLALADAKSPRAQKAQAKAKLPPPVALPSLELRVAELRWGQMLLGRLELALRSAAGEQRLERLTLDQAGVLTASGSGDWQRGAGGGRSAVKLTLQTEQLGAVLRLLDGVSAVEAGRARAELQLHWRGGFNAFDWQTAESVIEVDVGAGRLLKVEPGLGRLLGVINFGALSRRLTLDFSDLYGKGFAFERIKGRVSIRDGRAEVSGFTIDGPAGLVQIEGETDLIARQFQQTVTVAPKLGSGIALAGAVAGGPVVGAAVYLVDKVAGNPFDRLTRYRYRVTGSWQEPKFQRVGWESLLNPSVPTVREETNHFLSDH